MRSKKLRLLANDFFNELIERRLTSADRIIGKIKREAVVGQWQKGYINALEGMILALRSSRNSLTVINQIDNNDTKKFARTFSRLYKNKMQAEFDRGFFAAWVDYTKLRVL